MAVDLEFLSKQHERILNEFAGFRDDMRVPAAIVMRLDNTRERHEGVLTDILREIRAIHAQIRRMDDRVRRLENATP